MIMTALFVQPLPRRREAPLVVLCLALAMTQVATVQAFSVAQYATTPRLYLLPPSHPRAARRQHQPLQVSLGPLRYRDRDATEEEMTTTLTTTAASHSSTTTTAYGNTIAHIDDLSQSLPHMDDMDMGAIQLSLLQSMCASQVMALGIASVVATILAPQLWGAMFYSSASPEWRVMEGVVAAIPLIAMNSHIEHSDEQRADGHPTESMWASHVSFSITNTVVALFGRRRRNDDSSSVFQRTAQENTRVGDPSKTTTMSQVAAAGGILAGVSAISEEMIFRGLLPTMFLSIATTALSALSASSTLDSSALLILWLGCAVVGPAVLYGACQLRPTSSKTENAAFALTATIQGLWYGCFSLLTGGDLVPLMIAHALYEGHVLTEAWMKINDQMDYAEDACKSHHAPAGTSSSIHSYDLDVAELEHIRHETANSRIHPEMLAFSRRFFYTFDSEHQGALSLSDVQRAVTYAFLQEGQLVPGADKRPPNTSVAARAQVPTPEKVREVFDYMIQARKQQKRPGGRALYVEALDEAGDPRLRVCEFLRLLFALQSKAPLGQKA